MNETALRLAAADTCFVQDPPAPTAPAIFDLWSNPSNIPGAFSAVALELPVRVGDLEWTAEHAAPWSSSIGYSLAVESSGAAPLVPAGRAWTTAHLWRRDTAPATTLCGRQVPDADLTAAPDLPVCGQCRRRATTTTTSENPS